MRLTRRLANGLGLLAVLGLFAGAFYFQYVVHLEPCNMCMLQRLATAALGLFFLLALLHDAGKWFARFYGLLIFVAAAALFALSARHVWMQLQPPGSLASCGADFWTMMSMLPFTDVVLKIINGGGDCQEIGWSLFGISIPGWLGLAALVLALWGLLTNFRCRRAGGRA